MKTKILGIMVCMLVILSAVAIAEPTRIKQISNVTTNFDDDVPTWSVGDSWTYILDEISIDYNVSGQKLLIDGMVDDFTWTVSDTSGSNYILDITGKITAVYEIYVSSPSMTLWVSGTFKPMLTRITGTISFTKSGLELVDLSAEIKGISMAKIYPIPISLPIPFKLTIDIDFNKAFPLFDFPLVEPTKSWIAFGIEADVNLSIGGIFGLIQVPVNLPSNYPLILFECEGKQDITVQAGIFSSYKITPILGDFFEYHYAPSVGNIVKIQVNMPNSNIHGELKSTNRI